MESKYYTPSIEEFYVGFEYEVLSLDSDIEACIYKWDKEMVTENSNILGYMQDIKMGKTRVKHLDKEDIESLGFEQESIYSFKHKDWYIEVSCNELHNQKDTLDVYCVSDCRFKGHIKNKSELKKLLKMLGV